MCTQKKIEIKNKNNENRLIANNQDYDNINLIKIPLLKKI